MERLLAHEASYMTFAARCEEHGWGWILRCEALPRYRDGNRALRLRDDGRGAEAAALEVMAAFRSTRSAVVADVDAVAERQGIGRALRRLGLQPVQASRELLQLREPAPFLQARSDVKVESLPEGEAAAWVEMALTDDLGQPAEAMWRAVLSLEARDPRMRLFRAVLNGEPAAACSAFASDGWARVENVVTRKEMRGRGAATALVAAAAAECLALGAEMVYLFVEMESQAARIYRRLGFERAAVEPLRRHILE